MLKWKGMRRDPFRAAGSSVEAHLFGMCLLTQTHATFTHWCRHSYSATASSLLPSCAPPSYHDRKSNNVSADGGSSAIIMMMVPRAWEIQSELSCSNSTVVGDAVVMMSRQPLQHMAAPPVQTPAHTKHRRQTDLRNRSALEA